MRAQYNVSTAPYFCYAHCKSRCSRLCLTFGPDLSGAGVGAHAAGQLCGVFSADVDEATLASVARVSTAATAGALVSASPSSSSSSSSSAASSSSSSLSASALPAQAFDSATRNRLTAVGVELLLSALLAGAYERYAAAQPVRAQVRRRAGGQIAQNREEGRPMI